MVLSSLAVIGVVIGVTFYLLEQEQASLLENQEIQEIQENQENQGNPENLQNLKNLERFSEKQSEPHQDPKLPKRYC